MHHLDVPGLVSILVHIPGGSVISVDKVPANSTAAELLSRLIGLPSIEVTGVPQLTTLTSEVIHNSAFLDDTEYELQFVPEKPNFLQASFFFSLFLMIHSITILLAVFETKLRAIIAYIMMLYLLCLCCVILKPSGHILKDMSLKPKNNPVVDFLWVLLRSFLPTFRLEHVLLHD
jgi:hypothetical protein